MNLHLCLGLEGTPALSLLDENGARRVEANPVTLSGKWISEARQGWRGELCLVSLDTAHRREPFWKAEEAGLSGLNEPWRFPLLPLSLSSQGGRACALGRELGLHLSGCQTERVFTAE